jgi:hypothetical protein
MGCANDFSNILSVSHVLNKLHSKCEINVLVIYVLQALPSVIVAYTYSN